MEDIILINQTPNEKINKIINALIYFYKNIVNDNLLSVYIIGSYANKKNIVNTIPMPKL